MPRSTTQRDSPTDSSAKRSGVVRLVQITDPHLLSNPQSKIRGVNVQQSFEQVLQIAQPYIDAADAILLTGDIAHDELGSTYLNLVKRLNTLECPVWSLPGNHDNPMEMSHILSAGQLSYLGHHRCGSWEIILLDSHFAGNPAGLLGKAELDRLEKRLTHTDADHVFICLHHHPLPMKSQWLDKVALLDANAFFAVLKQSSSVRGVCYGHVHQATDQCVENVRYLSCPSTGTQFRPVSSDFKLDTRPPGFRWITLFPDGTIQSDVAWLNSPPWKI